MSHCTRWTGTSDFVNGLTVAVDILYRSIQDRPVLEKDNIIKRIIIVSNFLDAVSLWPPCALPLHDFDGMHKPCGTVPNNGMT
jgi:hypothetical protein